MEEDDSSMQALQPADRFVLNAIQACTELTSLDLYMSEIHNNAGQEVVTRFSVAFIYSHVLNLTKSFPNLNMFIIPAFNSIKHTEF